MKLHSISVMVYCHMVEFGRAMLLHKELFGKESCLVGNNGKTEWPLTRFEPQFLVIGSR